MPRLGLFTGVTTRRPLGKKGFKLLNAEMGDGDPSSMDDQSIPLQMARFTDGDGYQLYGGDHNYSGWMENGLGLGSGNDGMAMTAKRFNFTTPAAYSPIGKEFKMEIYNHGYQPRKIALISKEDHDRFGIGIGPYSLLRYRGAKGFFWGNVFNTGKSYLAQGTGDTTSHWSTTKRDGWGSTFSNIWAYNPYAPNLNCPHELRVREDGYVEIWRNGVLEFTTPNPIDYDFVVMCDSHYMAQYTRNVKMTGVFVPMEYEDGWDTGEYSELEQYGTSTFLYMGDTLFAGNGNGYKIRSKKRMLPGSWMEPTPPTQANMVKPISVGAYGCQWMLSDTDYSTNQTGFNSSTGLRLHYQSTTQYNQYFNGTGFTRNIQPSMYEDPALITDSGWTSLGKRNPMDVRTGGHRLRWVWAEDKTLQMWINHSIYGLIHIHTYFAPQLVSYLTNANFLCPWMLFDNAYSYAQGHVRMGGNIETY